MQLKLFAFKPPFQPERRLLAARPVAARTARRDTKAAPLRRVPTALIDQPDAPAVKLPAALAHLSKHAIERDSRLATQPDSDNSSSRSEQPREAHEAPQMASLIATLAMRKEHGMYGAAHPYGQQIRSVKQRLDGES